MRGPSRIHGFKAGVGLALNAIRAHKMRAFLTVLGVIIGTGTIIGVGCILTGLDGAITNIIRSFGTENIIAFKLEYRSPRRRTLARRVDAQTPDV